MDPALGMGISGKIRLTLAGKALDDIGKRVNFRKKVGPFGFQRQLWSAEFQPSYVAVRF